MDALGAPRFFRVGASTALRAVHGGAGRLLPVRQVAERLGVSTATVYGPCDRGEIAFVPVDSTVIRIRPEKLESVIRRG